MRVWWQRAARSVILISGSDHRLVLSLPDHLEVMVAAHDAVGNAFVSAVTPPADLRAALFP